MQEPNHFHCNPGKEVAARYHAVRRAQWVRAGVRHEYLAPVPRRARDVTASGQARDSPGSRAWRPARSRALRTKWATRYDPTPSPPPLLHPSDCSVVQPVLATLVLPSVTRRMRSHLVCKTNSVLSIYIPNVNDSNIKCVDNVYLSFDCVFVFNKLHK